MSVKAPRAKCRMYNNEELTHAQKMSYAKYRREHNGLRPPPEKYGLDTHYLCHQEAKPATSEKCMKTKEDYRKAQAANDKPWKFNAAYSREAVDFYEIAGTLSRKHPMAYVHADTNGGYVVVHKQLIRQANAKFGRQNTEMPGSSYSHPLPTQGYPLSFQDAFVFIVDHPKAFNEWSKWAKKVRQAPWRQKKATFSVNYPKV